MPSAWALLLADADDAAEAVEDASMPPRDYTLLHPDARLTAEEQAMEDAGGDDRSGSPPPNW